jgi:hypothetical protein
VSKVVSERGTGGATFAAVVMIIGGTLRFFRRPSSDSQGQFLRPTSQLLDQYGRGRLGLVAPDCGSYCPGCWLWSHLWGGLGPLARHHLREHPGLTNFLFIPAQPFWAITLILIDLWIIHSLFVHRREPV